MPHTKQTTTKADNEQPIPDCSYCDKPIVGSFERYGGAFLHPACYRQLGEDLAATEDDTFEPGDN
jgi:hypothetical protein